VLREQLYKQIEHLRTSVAVTSVLNTCWCAVKKLLSHSPPYSTL